MGKDIIDYNQELEKISTRLKFLQDRFLAIAMDYKHYIKDDLNDTEIYNLRDNVQYRLYSARFHFQLLLEHHVKVEYKLIDLSKNDPTFILKDSMERMYLQMQSTKEAYSLFDSMIYHLCSIYDYMFRLINFTTGKTIPNKPKWNLFRCDKNLRNFEFCNKDIIPKLIEIDDSFVYPLIKHRSHLIHTENDTGNFVINSTLGKNDFKVKFLVTKLFLDTFPNINIEYKPDISITQASLWLINQTITTTTEILFELKDDLKRNKKQDFGMFVMLDEDRSIQPMSKNLWGDRNIN